MWRGGMIGSRCCPSVVSGYQSDRVTAAMPMGISYEMMGESKNYDKAWWAGLGERDMGSGRTRVSEWMTAWERVRTVEVGGWEGGATGNERHLVKLLNRMVMVARGMHPPPWVVPPGPQILGNAAAYNYCSTVHITVPFHFVKNSRKLHANLRLWGYYALEAKQVVRHKRQHRRP